MSAPQDFQAPPPAVQQQKQAARAKAAADAAQVQQMQALRAAVPGEAGYGTPQYQAIQQQAQAQRQAAFTGINPIASSADQFASARQTAISSGRFDYGAVSSAAYTPPQTFVNNLGQVVNRQTSLPAPTPPTVAGSPIDISTSQLAKTDALRAQMGLPPLEQTNQVVVVKGTQSLPVPQTKGAPTDISKTILGTSSSQPQTLEQAITQSFISQPRSTSYAGSASGSYLIGLYQKGIITKSDLDRINQSVQQYNQQVQTQNIQIKQQNIATSIQERQQLTNTLQQAKQAGVSNINILDSKGNVIGSVNPQNVSEARLQFLNLTAKQTQPVSLQYQTAKEMLLVQ